MGQGSRCAVFSSPEDYKLKIYTGELFRLGSKERKKKCTLRGFEAEFNGSILKRLCLTAYP